MGVFQRVNSLLTPKPDHSDQVFTLGDRGRPLPVERESLEHRLRTGRERADRLASRLDRWLAADTLYGDPSDLEKLGDLSSSLEVNISRLKFRFRSPRNIDLVVREVVISTHPQRKAAVIYLDGLIDKYVVNLNILEPMMLMANLKPHPGEDPQKQEALDLLEPIEQQLVPAHTVVRKYDLHDLETSILMGDTAVLVDGCASALDVDTKGFPLRSITTPQNERVIEGPHDAFNESFRMNTALIRRRVKDARMVTEVAQVGDVSSIVVGVCYLDGVTNPKLVAEAKKRLNGIEVDYIGNSGMLQSYIEDQPSALIPQILSTERPDRAAAALSEGSVVIVCDCSSQALIMPTTFWSLMQSSEDYYLRWPYGNFVRVLRFSALLTALLLPGLYIAATTFHQEMIPTELLLSITANREAVPMPAVLELLLMDASFELIREAGTRVPNVIGATIGIIGGLILGQAAVTARLVSPMMIIIVAITGLASFAIPSYTTAFGVRLMRFAVILAGATFGFYGIAAGVFTMILHLASLRSMGVPLLGPLIRPTTSSPDTVLRPHLFDMERRPAHARPLDPVRQARKTRPWDPTNPVHDGKNRRGHRKE